MSCISGMIFRTFLSWSSADAVSARQMPYRMSGKSQTSFPLFPEAGDACAMQWKAYLRHKENGPWMSESTRQSSEPMDSGNVHIILGSASPRRKELLSALGLDFEVDTGNTYKEDFSGIVHPAEIPSVMSKGKSHGFHRPLSRNELLITADTIVLCRNRALGKPHDREEAFAMLTELSGKTHEVITAVTLRSVSRETTFSDTAKVTFLPLEKEEIDYYIDNYITEFGEDGITESTDKNKIYHVKRFNDTFHNEAVIGKIGIMDKTWADRLVFSFNYSHFYKEIQTGVYQYVVFGQKHRKGYSFVPSVEYRKRNLLIEGLDISATANYNHNITHNIDTAAYKYNWLGDKKYTGTPGEQSHQNNESKNTNWNGAFTANYRIGEAHTFTLNHVISTFHRTTRSYISGSSKLSDFSIPKKTRKNITGLSYRYMPSDKWNISAFTKYYNQYNEGPVSQNSDGIGNYTTLKKHLSSLGYGVAGTYFIIKDLQAKLSYEKAYRLPTTEELFGDEDLEAGKADLKPERSDNFNLNLSYAYHIGTCIFYHRFSPSCKSFPFIRY